MTETLPDGPVKGVIFDLGGTLLDWPDWDGQVPKRWARTHSDLLLRAPASSWPPLDAFVAAMADAEAAHWKRVTEEHWSGPPSGLIGDGFHRLGRRATGGDIVTVLDAYARAVDGTAVVFPDSRATLEALRSRGLKLVLLSNTWWAADWHNADLATHGLADFFDELVYTSDLPHSKPHPAVFVHAAALVELEPAECVMVGDWPEYDIVGAVAAGMRAIWKTNGIPRRLPDCCVPSATIEHLAELPGLLAGWES